MRLPALLILAACAERPPEPVPSERGPAMVRVTGDVVRLGWKKHDPVDGVQWEAVAPGGGAPSGAGGPQGPPNPNGPRDPPSPTGAGVQGPANPRGTGPQGPPPGGPAGPPNPNATPGPPNPNVPPGPPPPANGGAAGPSGALVLPWLVGSALAAPDLGLAPAAGPPALPRGSAPDLGLAPGASAPPPSSRPMPDPLDPVDVRVSEFWIDVTEVTQEQYALFLGDTGYRPPYVEEEWAEDGWDWDGTTPPKVSENHPVVLVSWHDARAYCAWAGKRLPTEAEWQLAVLGPKDDERVFPWGDEYDADKLNHGRLEDPNYDPSDGWERTSPVGAYPQGASRWGLLDAFGNAWEWTADVRVRTWDEVLGERHDGVIEDPHTAPVGLYAAVRGGAYFFDFRPNPGGERNGFLLELRRKTSGFRCAKDA